MAGSGLPSAATNGSVPGRLLGRDDELEALRTFLTQEAGPVAALVLEGPAGVGKTTLWEYGVVLGRELGLRVLISRASGAETGLAFTTLIDLLDGMDPDSLAGLPEPQRAAIEVALFRASPAGPLEPQANAIAVLSALRVLAAGGRVLVAIDDVQWADPASEQALVYAARRVDSSQVIFLLARRRGSEALLVDALQRGSTARLAVAPLGLGATRQVLADRLGLRLPHHMLRRVHEATGGNPLFVLEVGRALVREGADALVRQLPVPEHVEDLVGLRVVDLEPSVRRALLAIALDADLRTTELERVAGVDAVGRAVREGVLLTDGDRVRSAHPLLAATAEKRSSPGERDELHRSLAEVVTEGERRFLHLALAARDPDDDLAERLATEAQRAEARGATLLAGALDRHSVRLTPSDSTRAMARLLQLGKHLMVAGEKRALTDLLSGRIEEMPPGAARARAYVLLTSGVVRDNDHILELLERALAEAGAELGGDEELHASVLAELARNQGAISIVDLPAAARRAEEALAATSHLGREGRLVALDAVAWTRALTGLSVEDLCAEHRLHADGHGYLAVGPDRVAAQRMVWRGEIAPAKDLLAALLAHAADRVEPSSYALVRLHLCELALRTGEWADAQALLDEWVATDSELLHWPMYERCRALLAAGRGDPADARQWGERALQRAEAARARWDWLEAHRALGLADLLDKDGDAAVKHFATVWDHTQHEGVSEPGVFPVAVDLVEALCDTGDADRARVVTARLEELAHHQDHPWARAGVLRCEALIRVAAGFDDGAGAGLVAAAAAYEQLGLAFDAARTTFLLGRAQRRARKWGAAAESLDAAATAFAAMGSGGWADQARAERARVGARRSWTVGGLTSTEREVAELAAEGMTNKEIARHLVVTVSTVEFHLRNTFAKLGIRSRAQIAARLGGSRTAARE